MAKSALVQRVEKRLREIGKGPVEAAARVSGMERNFIRDLLEGKKTSFSEAKAAAVAEALEWTVAELRGEDHAERGRRERVTRIPLVSWVSAGKLTDVESQLDITEVPLLAFADLGRGEFFALTVEGDSMDRFSPPGSRIVVNRAQRDLVAGKPYIFWHRTEGTTYKFWQADPPRLDPASWNPANKPHFLKRKTDIEVIGRVRRTILDL